MYWMNETFLLERRNLEQGVKHYSVGTMMKYDKCIEGKQIEIC